ncbi:hypothetical protein C9374_006919 [Naegleria lovaniensis]|uniref:BTB domain-containing protein n=1 Tax=Naegleria lovaniensis TaxID=51637 RepID=A0AA88H2I7_NAELO|nr:uncharacterized protein C9374_006919 [Naegleria lovaniensis]KAG2393388.1 hypothetical protein C9374_006919 [Naegleria lovaniensis]
MVPSTTLTTTGTTSLTTVTPSSVIMTSTSTPSSITTLPTTTTTTTTASTLPLSTTTTTASSLLTATSTTTNNNNISTATTPGLVVLPASSSSSAGSSATNSNTSVHPLLTATTTATTTAIPTTTTTSTTTTTITPRTNQHHNNRTIVIGKPTTSTITTTNHKDPSTDLVLLQQYRTDIMRLFESELLYDLIIVVGPLKLIGSHEDEDHHSSSIMMQVMQQQHQHQQRQQQQRYKSSSYTSHSNDSSEIRLKNKYYPADECSVVEFKVHRAILCARCDYFNKLFHSQMKDSSQTYLKFPDKRPEDMKCLLDFFYSAVININHSNAFGVLKLSDELGVQIVKEKCIEYVKECVMSDNVFDVLEESTFHNFDELRKYCKEYLEENAIKLFFSESFLNISKETLIDLLKSDKIHLGELDIFMAVLLWGKHQLIHKMGISIMSQKSASTPTNAHQSTSIQNSSQNNSSAAGTTTKTVISYSLDGSTQIKTEKLIENSSVKKSGAATGAGQGTIESLTDRNLSISEQQKIPNALSQPTQGTEYAAELSISEQHAKQQLHHDEEDETERDCVDEIDDDDFEEEIINSLAYSTLNPASMLTNNTQSRIQDAGELQKNRERIQKIVNYTHDKQFVMHLAKLLHDVLQHVRFPTLDPIEVYECVEISKVVPNELLLEAYRAHALQNRIDLFNSARLKVREGSLFYVSGVCTDVPISKLKGWCLFYHKPYHHPTSEADIQAGKGTRILIGARHKNSSTLALCAMGMKQKVLRETFEHETTKENGCYFYHWKNHSFGFSDTPNVQLGTADLSEGAAKLSWHLTGRGGYRCGFLTSLNESKEWEKMLFYA